MTRESCLRTFDSLIELALLCLILFSPFAFGSTRLEAQTAVQLGILLIGFLWLIKSAILKEIQIIKTILYLPIGLFLIYLLFQLVPFSEEILSKFHPEYDTLLGKVLSSEQQSVPRTFSIYRFASLLECLRWSMLFLLFISLIHLLQRKSQVSRLFRAMVFTGIGVALFGIVQRLTWNGKFFWIWEIPERIFPFGPYLNHNHFAGLMELVIPLAIGLGLTSKEREKKIFFFFSGLFMTAALFLSLSRGAILSLSIGLVAMGLIAFLHRVTRKRVWVIFLFCLFLGGILLSLFWTPLVQEFAGSFEDIRAEDRWPVWQATMKMVHDFPVFGTGFGTFQYLFPYYRPESVTLSFRYVHNDYLQGLVEGGVIGGILLISLVVIFGGKLLVQWIRRRDRDVVWMTFAGGLSLLSLLIHSAVDFNLHVYANALYFTLVAAGLFSLVHLRQRKGQDQSLFRFWKIPLRKPVQPLYCLSLFLVVGFVGFPIMKPYKIDKRVRETKKSEGDHHFFNFNIHSSGEARIFFQAGILATKKANEVISGKEQWLKKAITEYERAIFLNPFKSQYHVSLGWALGRAGRRQEAIQEFQRAILLDPFKAAVHRTFGYWSFQQGSEFVVLGFEEYKKALLLDSSYAEEALEEYFVFTKDFLKLRKIIPSGVENSFQILYQFLTKKGEEVFYEIGKEKNQEELRRGCPYYHWLAWKYSDEGDAPKAIRLLESYLEKDPENAEAHFWIADRASYEQLRYGSNFVKRHFQKAIELDPENVFFHHWFGRNYFYWGKLDQAVVEFKKAIKIGPSDHVSHFWLGKTYRKLGKMGRAMFHYEKALHLSPENEKYRRELKKFHYNRSIALTRGKD